MEHFFIDKSFCNFDEFAHAAQVWDLHFKQLDKGEFRTDMLQFASNNSLIAHARFNRHFDQHGSPPPGKWTFAIFSEQTLPFVWHGKKISNNTISIYKPGSEIDSVTQPGFETFVLSYTEEYLNELCADTGLPEINKLANGTDLFKCSLMELSRIRQQLHQEIDSLKNRSPKVDILSSIRKWEIDFPEQILMILSRSLPVTSSSLRERHRAIKLIKQYLAEFPHEPVTVVQLCKIAGVSIRTLQYAFHEHYSVTPKTYLKNFRLNGVRRELWNSDPLVTRVNDIATIWGFWHMGQFAADYRKLFGELPSETLLRRK